MGGLGILNISDLKKPVRISQLYLGGGYAIEGDYTYLANSDTGFHILDIRKPGAPKLEASFDTPGEAQATVLSGPLVLVADSNSLIILK
jgi:hypothetical protein